MNLNKKRCIEDCNYTNKLFKIDYQLNLKNIIERNHNQDYIINYIKLNINYLNLNDPYILVALVYLNYIKVFELLIHLKLNWNFDISFDNHLEDGLNVILVSTLTGNIEIIKLLSNYVNINFQDKNGLTPLMHTVKNNNMEIFEFLISNQESNVNITDKFDDTVLHYAILFERNDMMKLIVSSKNFNSNIRTTYGDTYLIRVVSNNNYEGCKIMLDSNKFYVNSTNDFQNSALHYSSIDGNYDITKNLLEYGKINIDGQDRDGDTALLNACRGGHLEVVNLLLNHNANINIKNDNDETPLLLAIELNNIHLLKILLQNEKIDRNLMFPVHLAAKYNNFKFVKLLISDKTDLNLVDDDGYTPLMISIENFKYNIAKELLLNNKVDRPNYLNNNYVPFYKSVLLDVKKVRNNKFKGIVRCFLKLKRKRLKAAERVYSPFTENNTGFIKACNSFNSLKSLVFEDSNEI